MTEIGNRLKEARLAKGLSLDDLQGMTKIQKRYLLGIEEGNYSSMPGNFYVRAFIKQYAEAVGLEADVLFEEFKGEIPNAANDDLTGQLSRVQSRKNFSETSSKVLDILPKLLIGVFIVGAFVFVWYFLAQRDAGDTAKEPAPNDNNQVTYEVSEDLAKEEPVKTEKDTQQDTKAESKKVNEKKTKDKEKDSAKEDTTKTKQELTVKQTQGDESSFELTNAEKFELKLVSTGETWVNVKNGKGYSFFQGMLQKGGTESQTFDLSQETDVVIVVGNTTATEIYVNNQKLEYAINPSDVVRQDIAIHYVKSEAKPEQ
ncbi:cytoskeletal protein RodZ [Bacillus benzoevorans]|uniref:Cytoskeletal protein RodZ n=1 Tax=Bacillus benzoevorans TaxID=1456 RepID=A0A7X0HNT1_9BACI|nr:RodZ domain-containing protein [Bacillus benzoevorans]MBB6444203.1 cytoskeletal protein RodZ [Bacillus benzoevorans]